jgi:hypothetical protein
MSLNADLLSVKADLRVVVILLQIINQIGFNFVILQEVSLFEFCQHVKLD